MGINLERLEFNSSAPTDGPTIGSFVIGLDGAVVTSTTVGSDEALDVISKVLNNHFRSPS